MEIDDLGLCWSLFFVTQVKTSLEKKIDLYFVNFIGYSNLEADLDHYFVPSTRTPVVHNPMSFLSSTFTHSAPLISSCTAHTLQLVVKDGFTELKRTEVCYLSVCV